MLAQLTVPTLGSGNGFTVQANVTSVAQGGAEIQFALDTTIPQGAYPVLVTLQVCLSTAPARQEQARYMNRYTQRYMSLNVTFFTSDQSRCAVQAAVFRALPSMPCMWQFN